MDRILHPVNRSTRKQRTVGPPPPIEIDGDIAGETDFSVDLETHLEDICRHRARSLKRFLLLQGVLKAAAETKRAEEEASEPENKPSERPADRSEALVALNRAGRRCLENCILDTPSQPILVVCADAAGGLGVLEPAFRFMDIPCLALDVLQDHATWHAENLESVVGNATALLRRTLPACNNLLVSGLGFGALLAHNICVMLEKSSPMCCALVLLEGDGVLPDNAAAVDWIEAAHRDILCQLAAQAYDLSVASGRRAVSKEAIVVRLSVVDSVKDQLRLLGTLCPTNEDRLAWSAQVEAAMLRFAIFRKLALAYRPDGSYSGQTTALLQRERGFACEGCLETGGPDKMWTSVLPFLHPIALFLLPGRGPRTQGWTAREVKKMDTQLQFALRLQDKEFRERAHKIVAALEAAGYIQGGAIPMGEIVDGAETAGTTTKAKLPAEENIININIPRPHVSEDAGRELHAAYQNAEKMSQEEEFESTHCLVVPLNSVARDFLSEIAIDAHNAWVLVGESSSTSGQMLQERNNPLWVFHTECGEITQGQRSLAKLVKRPVLGLALGPDALADASSLEALTLHYSDAIISLQKYEPYLLLATGSPTSAALAHATAMHMQRAGLRAGLVFADCAVAFDAALEAELNAPDSRYPPFYIPDATAYGLYYFLTELGTLQCSIGEFARQLHNTYTPWEQLLLLDDSRPQIVAQNSTASAAWDAALYAVVQRSSVMKQLLIQQEIQRAAPGFDLHTEGIFKGLATLMIPSGVEGMLMEAAAKDYVLVGRKRVEKVLLGCPHGQALTTEMGLQELGIFIAKAAAKMERRLVREA